MENNFDKYFKEKFENREFEMKPEYWEGAEALIEADERGGYWNKFMLFFGMALMVGVIGLFVWKNNNTNTISQVEENPSFNNETLLDKAKLNEEKVVTKNLENKNTENNSGVFENGFSPPSNSSNELTGKKESQKNFSQNQKTEPSKNTTNKTKSSSTNSFAQAIPENVLVPSTSFEKRTNLTSNSAIGDIKSNSTINSKPTIVDIKPSGNFNSVKDEKTDFPINKTEPSIQEEDSNQNAKEKELNKKESNLIEKVDKNKNESETRAVASISGLDIFLFTKLDKDIQTKVECFPLTKKKRTYQWGLTGGVVGYPLIENSSTDPFIGLKGGFFAERNLKNHFFRNKWSIGMELLYHYRSGNFVATREEAVVQYSFGSTSTSAKLTPKNLHYLEMPIYLKYHLNDKVSFEGGGLVSYLLGARGEVDQNDEVVKGWVDELGFNKVHTNAILGFQYSLTDKIRLGLRANFSLNSILDKNAILPNGEALRESGPMYLTFKFSQYLK